MSTYIKPSDPIPIKQTEEQARMNRFIRKERLEREWASEPIKEADKIVINYDAFLEEEHDIDQKEMIDFTIQMAELLESVS